MSEFDWLDEPAPALPLSATEIKIKAIRKKQENLPVEWLMHFRYLRRQNWDVERAAREYNHEFPDISYEYALAMWDDDDFVAEVERLKRKLLPKKGITPSQILLDTRRVVDEAMTPQPILYKGEPTGYQEIDAGAALKGLELLGKNQKVWNDENKAAVTIGIELIDWAGPKPIEGEVVDGESVS